MSETKPRITILGPNHFRDNLIHTTLAGEQFRREWIVLNDHKSAKNHKHACEIAQSCTEHGGGWDLAEDPSVIVGSIVNYDNIGPAVHSELKDVLKSDWYWTKKVHASNSVYAWGADLSSGSVSYSYRNYYGLVLACRRVPPSQ